MADAKELFRNRIIGYGVKPADQFQANPLNYRTHPQRQRDAVRGSLTELGWIAAVVENVRSGHLIDGHERIWQALPENEDVPYLQVDLSEDEEKLALAIFDPLTNMAETDAAILDTLLRDISTGDEHLQQMLADMAADAGLYLDKSEPVDAEPQIDRAEELREKWGVQSGDLWQLGQHRLICGDCTDADVVARVMGGERAGLCHADPPYGMGKEKDGIENDNLYREKLDAFQVQWWGACRPSLTDNASTYIWGNAEDLWRLWYVGGLRDSERMTLRNEVVWDKGHGQGMSSDIFRSYAPATERVLFFMLGEQGFNNNADNYWDGWEPIRAYLYQEAEKIGINNSKAYNTTLGLKTSGGGMYAHHISPTGSQFAFITREHYTTLQAAANGQAFKREYDELKREYDELKREFYATRAYFDNEHDNMTDVWRFERVQGDERHGHATPKPVPLVARAIKSSCPDGSIVLVPFGGTAPEIIASESLNRLCRAAEISPSYCAVILQRFADATGKQPQRVE